MKDMNGNKREPLIEGKEALPRDAFRFPEPPEGLRESIYARTRQVVRARARGRRIAVLALMAAAYIGGITTAFLATDRALREPDNGLVAALPGKKGTDQETDEWTVSPAELMRRAESALPDEKIRLLREAGDRFLSEGYDVENALACYRKALDTMPESGRTRVEEEDSWLLAALKVARR
jgi:hypothetical protein